ncbi:MAG: hypothetical protein RLY68_910, partial [Actinomycetota bacterium]
MGEAILKGLLDNVVSAQDIVCVDKVQASVDRISQRYQVVCSTEISAIKDCDVVVLGVKPQNMDEVLPLIGKHINQNTLIISIAVGITSSYIAKNLGINNAAVVRAMPNTPALVGKGVTGLAKGEFATAEHLTIAKNLLAAAYGDDKVEIAVGPTASPVALAMLPVAEEYKKILLVEPAVADSITGDKWNKYIFRTGRNSSQDAISNAVALDKAGYTIATMAQDSAFGRDGVKAFRESLKNAKLVHEEFLPPATTDFTAGAQHLIDKLKSQPGRKIIFIIWAGGNPFKIADMDLKRYGIEIATGGNIL